MDPTRSLAALVFLLVGACAEPVTHDAGSDGTSGEVGCGARYEQHPPDPGLHVEPDASITWSTNPPSSGTHFAVWARWGIHQEIVPRGHYVHNLEHGGVAVLYRCIAPDCRPTQTALEALVRGLPPEPRCTGSGVPRRIVLTEDPLIDSPVAAASWGFTYRADCFDEGSLRAFILAHTGMAPEDECAEGAYP